MTHSRPARRAVTVAVTAVVAAALVAGDARGGQTRRFTLDTPRALAGATGTGVAVLPDGTLRALAPLVRVAELEEPLGLALAVAPDGTAYVGTGSPARVYRVRDGRKELVSDLAADQVTALLVDPTGTVWASTAIPAALHRMAPGAATFTRASALAEGNLWDLAWYRGGVVAAAGNPGRLLRLGAKGLELAAEIADQHARCLAVSGDALLVGTSGKGRILRWNGDAPPGVLYDSGFTEIAALAAEPSGVVWAAALTGDPTLGKPPARDDGDGSGGASVTVVATDQSAAPPATEKGTATSEILRVLPAGAALTAHRFAKQIAGALEWTAGGLVIGTGLDGELWQLVEGAAARLDTVDAAQVVRVARGGEWVLTQGPVRLLRRTGPPRGTFTSPALDAGQPARWGEVEVRADVPAGGSCTLRFRSGAAADPDDSWSAWTAAQPCGAGRVAAPAARYLQWQAELAPGDGAAAANVESVAVAFQQVNLPPEIKELTVHEPGEVFLKTPPPSERIVDVRHPDLSGVFTTLSDDGQEFQDRLGKKYWRVGYQTLSWKAEDANGDPLRFTLAVQRRGADRWWPVREDLETISLGIDTGALPDGLYRFRLSATDAVANPADPARDEMLSGWVAVDNTAPRVSAVRKGDAWVVTVEDAGSPLAVLEWSRDAGEWKALPPDDGALDGRLETARLAAAAGAHLVAVRAIDDHHNRATVALEEKP